MSDLNSSVRDEQVGNTNEITDNTDPLAPLAEEHAKSESSENDVPDHLKLKLFRKFFEEVEDEAG